MHNTQLHEATKSDLEVLLAVSHAIAFSTAGSSLAHTNRKEQRVENARLFIVHNNTQLRELAKSQKVALKYLHVVSHETTCSTAGSSLAHRNSKEQRVKNARLFIVHNNTQLRELAKSQKVALKHLHVVSHETTCSTAGSSLAHRNSKEQRVKNARLFIVQVVPARWHRWRCRRT